MCRGGVRRRRRRRRRGSLVGFGHFLVEVDLFVLIDVLDADGPETVELQAEDDEVLAREEDGRVRLNFEVHHGDEANDEKGQVLHENGDEDRREFAAGDLMVGGLHAFGLPTLVLLRADRCFLVLLTFGLEPEDAAARRHETETELQRRPREDRERGIDHLEITNDLLLLEDREQIDHVGRQRQVDEEELRECRPADLALREQPTADDDDHQKGHFERHDPFVNGQRGQSLEHADRLGPHAHAVNMHETSSVLRMKRKKDSVRALTPTTPNGLLFFGTRGRTEQKSRRRRRLLRTQRASCTCTLP